MKEQGEVPDLLKLASLDEKAAHEWRQLAAQVVHCRTGTGCARANITLEAAVAREPQSPAAPAFRLWMADNLARDARYADAVVTYDAALEQARSAGRLLEAHDPIIGVLHHKAQAAASAGDFATAIATYADLGRYSPDDADPFFQAGLLAERRGRYDEAADFFRRIARGSPSSRTNDPAELARRELLRLELPQSAFAEDAGLVVAALSDALERRDVAVLQGLASRSHFAAGPVGGHTVFESDDVPEMLYRDLRDSEVSVRRTLLGTGAKRYLPTSGWKGKWFRGDVVFLITRAARGWQWTGVAIAAANDLWVERWRPAVKQKNQPLPFELYAPWPIGQCFTAGGLTQFIGQQAAVLAGGLIGGSLLALYFASNDCGFGPRGFYYNQGSTHDEEDAFAIDFTRYRRYVPYDNESGGTPVLAARSGIVRRVSAGSPSGDSSASNTVEIEHADPANPADLSRFRSRYLHMEGPWRILVSEMMPVYTGNRLGRMDDTGNSILDHLHFSVHDRNLPYPGVPYGASVRPTPMSGVRLEDGDSGTCVCSTNVEYQGEKPMIEATNFAGQNWLITPAALSVNQAPGRIEDQQFLLVLSGVVIVDIKGNSGAQWRRETVSIRPDLFNPLQYAVAQHGIPTPPGSGGSNYWLGFRVEQWAPFAAPSSMFNKDHAVNSGFAVDTWRPNPFSTATGFGNATLDRLFSGIQVDVAVRDTDAWLHRVSYEIVLLGKIVFGPIIIT